MRVPEGRIIIQDARQEFASPENVVAYLGKKKFSGYICAQHGAQRDFILMEKGKVVSSFESIGPNFRFASLEKVLERANQGGSIFVGELGEDMLEMTRVVLEQKKIFENLHSDFTRLRPFLTALQIDSGSGVIEMVGFTDYGCIFIKEGAPRNAFFFGGNQYSEGVEALESILYEIDRGAHIINVYTRGG